MQFAPDARPAVSSAIGCIHGTNMHQQRLRAQVTTPSDLQPTNKVLVVARHTYPQHPALHTDRPHTPIASNQGVLHFCPLAKYAIAFPRMSRSIATRANSARKRLISICSAVTFERLSAPFSVPSRCALTQLNNVCSTRPNVRDAAAMLWPDPTSRTASCLNSSVYRARVALVIVFPFADCQLWDTFGGGKINSLRSSHHPPLASAKIVISTRFNNKQQAFLDFVLSHYVRVGVEELDQEKLTPLLRLKYHNSISDALADLGQAEEIGQVFAGFQRYLYQPQAFA